jgi:hypothetical protein
MKTKILSMLAIIAMALGTAACNDSTTPNPGVEDAVGHVRLASLGLEVSNSEKVITSTSRSTIDLSNYIVTISDVAGAKVKEWTYANMPEIFDITPGNYTVTVKSHEVEKAAWEKPYFLGSKTFTVKKDDITDIGVVTCKLSNFKVTIVYSDILKRYMGDDSHVTVTANDNGQLVYSSTETRAGYFEAVSGSSTLVAEFSGVLNGTLETKRVTLTNVEAGQHRIITFTVKVGPEDPDEEGQIDPNGLVVDCSVTEEDLNASFDTSEDIINPSDRPGGEGSGDSGTTEPSNPETPGETDPITFTSSTLKLDNTANDVSTLTEAVMHIHADAGFKNIIVDVVSDNDDFQSTLAGTLMPFDLCNPGDKESSLEELNFPTGDAVAGKTDVDLGFTAFLPLLPGFPGTHKFIITVTDKNNIQKQVNLILYVGSN